MNKTERESDRQSSPGAPADSTARALFSLLFLQLIIITLQFRVPIW